jgi:hypothetical protein
MSVLIVHEVYYEIFYMHRKTFTFFVLIIVLFSCKHEEPRIVFNEVNFSVPNNHIVDINIPVAIGNSEITVKINKAIQNRVSYSLDGASVNTNNENSINESIHLFNQEFENFKLDFPNSSLVWEAQIDGEISYQSNDIISCAITSYVNTGGAHGNLNIAFLNFNKKTGELIPNEALFKDLEVLIEVIKPYFLKSIKNKEIDMSDNAMFELPKNIGFNENGMIILYNPYEIASYSEGIIECTVPFEKIESCLVFNSL